MDCATSKDGTVIAFDRLGYGPPVILASGGSVDPSSNAALGHRHTLQSQLHDVDAAVLAPVLGELFDR